MKEVTLEDRLMIVTASVAVQILHECLDELEHTSFYKHSLKASSKKLQKELTKLCDPQTNHLWKVNEDSMVAIQTGILEMSKIIAQGDPAKVVAMGHLLITNPEILENK